MGTRSFIAKKIDNQNYSAVYCHWDGYPSHNGKILKESYVDESKVDVLISNGDISSLESEIGEKHDFDKRVENWTTFYSRDRGEEDVGAKTYTSLNELYKGAENHDAEYMYVYSDGVWYFSPLCSEEAGQLIELTNEHIVKNDF